MTKKNIQRQTKKDKFTIHENHRENKPAQEL